MKQIRQIAIRQEQAQKLLGYSKASVSELFKTIREDHVRTPKTKTYISDYLQGSILIKDLASYLGIDEELIYRGLEHDSSVTGETIQKAKEINDNLDDLQVKLNQARHLLNIANQNALNLIK